jgi:hypothetical protein
MLTFCEQNANLVIIRADGARVVTAGLQRVNPLFHATVCSPVLFFPFDRSSVYLLLLLLLLWPVMYLESQKQLI